MSSAMWRAAHREELVAYNAAYYAAHHEGRRVADASYRAAHRDERSAKWRAYAEAHPEKLRAYHATYHATPAGRESKARRTYSAWRKRIAQRLISKPSQIAALEAELERLVTHGT